MAIIGLFLFVLTLSPTWSYAYWLIKKRKVDDSFKKLRFKYLGYFVFSLNMLVVFMASENFKNQREQENAVEKQKSQIAHDAEYAKVQQCSDLLNDHLNGLIIKNLVVRFEVNKEINYIMAVVYNNYLYIHKHEKKQLDQLIKSQIKSLCGKEKRFHYVDQLYNYL